MGVLGEVADLEAAGALPMGVLNEWLELNTPSLLPDGHEQLIQSCRETLESYRDKNMWTIFDLLPYYIKRDVACEKQFLGHRHLEIQAAAGESFLKMRLRSAYERPSKQDAAQADRVTKLRARESSYYQHILRPRGGGASDDKVDAGGNPTEARAHNMSVLGVAHLASPLRRVGCFRFQYSLLPDNSLCMFVQIQRPKKRIHIKLIDRLFDAANEKDRTHINIKLSHLIWALVQQFPASSSEKMFEVDGLRVGIIGLINAILRRHPVGSWAPAVVGSIIMSVSHPACCDLWPWLDRYNYPLLCNIEKSRLLKDFATLLRRCRTLPDAQPVTFEAAMLCSYWYAYHGRLLSPVDWEKEREKRCGPSEKHYLPEFDPDSQWAVSHRHERLFYKELDELLQPFWLKNIAGRVGTQPLDRALDNRMKWATQGSDSQTKRIIFDGKPVQHQTKSMTIQQFSKKEFAAWLASTPAEHAVFSDKPNECGCTEGRAIGAPDMKHYCICSYATEGVEDNLKAYPGLEKGLQGASVVATRCAKINALDQFERGITSMEDFIDFNAQHDPLTEATLYFSQARAATLLNKDPDYIRAVRWHADSHLNKSMRLPDGSEHVVTRGLFSGTRATDIGNTLCNLGYSLTSSRHLLRVFPWLQKYLDKHQPFGRDPANLLYSVRQGDDVYEYGDRLYVHLKHELMVRSGFLFNPKKQMVGPYAEFLRIIYTSDSQVGFGARGLGSLLVGNCLATDIIDPVERLGAFRTHCAMLSRRGLPAQVVNSLLGIMRDKLGLLKHHRDDKRGLRVPNRLLLASRRSGGWGISDVGESAKNLRQTVPPTPALRIDLRGISDDMRDLALIDWFKLVSREFGATAWDIKAIHQTMRDDVRVGMMSTKHRLHNLAVLKEAVSEHVNRACQASAPGLPFSDPERGLLQADWGLEPSLCSYDRLQQTPRLCSHTLASIFQSRDFGISGWLLDVDLHPPQYHRGFHLIAGKNAVTARMLNAMLLPKARVMHHMLARLMGRSAVKSSHAGEFAFEFTLRDAHLHRPEQGGWRTEHLSRFNRYVDLSWLSDSVVDLLGSDWVERCLRFTDRQLQVPTLIRMRRAQVCKVSHTEGWARMAKLLAGVELPPSCRLANRRFSPLLQVIIPSVSVGLIAASAARSVQPPNRVSPLLQAARQILSEAARRDMPINCQLPGFLTVFESLLSSAGGLARHFTKCLVPSTECGNTLKQYGFITKWLFPETNVAKLEFVKLPIPQLVGRAIAASPLESVARTRSALKLTSEEAFIVCIQRSKVSPELRRQILQIHHRLLDHSDKTWLSVLRDGVRLDLEALDSIFTPEVIGVIQDYVVGDAIDAASYYTHNCGCGAEAICWSETVMSLLCASAVSWCVLQQSV